MPDFTRYKHPVLAVPCGDCHAPVDAWCKRPSGHRAADLHHARKQTADRAFVAQHGPDAEIHYDDEIGRWEIENADACVPVDP